MTERARRHGIDRNGAICRQATYRRSYAAKPLRSTWPAHDQRL
jgi:hypothetical protein